MCHGIIDDRRDLEVIISNPSFSTVLAEGLAPICPRTFTSAVVTKFGSVYIRDRHLKGYVVLSKILITMQTRWDMTFCSRWTVDKMMVTIFRAGHDSLRKEMVYYSDYGILLRNRAWISNKRNPWLALLLSNMKAYLLYGLIMFKLTASIR